MSKYLYGIAVVLLFAGFGEYSFGDELPCEKDTDRVCYVEIDIFEGSFPSSTNCYSEESVISVAIYGTTLYDSAPLLDSLGRWTFMDDTAFRDDFTIDELNEQTFALDSATPNEVHETVDADGTPLKVRHEAVDLLSVSFHTKLKYTELLGMCGGRTDVVLEGELMERSSTTDIVKIEGFGEINLVGGNDPLRGDNSNKPSNPGSENCGRNKIITPNCETTDTTGQDQI